MTDDRRRAGSTAPPPSGEPGRGPGEPLQYTQTMGPAVQRQMREALQAQQTGPQAQQAGPQAQQTGPQAPPPQVQQPLALQQTEWQQPLALQQTEWQQPLALQQTEWPQPRPHASYPLAAPQHTPQHMPQHSGEHAPHAPHTPHTPLHHTPLHAHASHPHASHPHTPVQHTPYEVADLPRPPAVKPVMPLGSVPPQDRGLRSGPQAAQAPELPYAPTITPMQLQHGETMDMRPPSRRGTPAADDPPPADGTLDLPASDRVESAVSLDPGQKIGRFVIRHLIGEGGMGMVLAGYDPDLGRMVAIKLVKPDVDRPAYRTRLLREAQALGRLEHPNVVRFYEVGSDRDRLFVAMELVDGVTLSEWLRVSRPTWREIVAMFKQVGAGLAAVHRAGLIHRDFKPDNVLVDREGRARVADFGLARLDPERGVATTRSPELAVALTRTGVMLGTPGYMAPEQQYAGSVDARADQYSFCITLREALVGSRTAKLDAESWGEVPRALRDVIARGLAYEPKERFPSMDELLLALEGGNSRRGTAISVAVAAVAIAGGIATTMFVMSRVRGGGASGEPPAVRADERGAAPELPPAADATSQRPGGAPISDVRAVPSSAARTVQPPGPPGPPGPGAGSSTGAPAIGAGSGTSTAPAAAGPGSGSAALGLVLGPPVPGMPGVNRAARRPEAWPSHPGHLAVVSATVQRLGYDGFDPGITASEVEKLSGMEQVIGKVKLGMVERRAGRCSTAVPLFNEARQVIPKLNSDASKWYARASIAQGLCAIAAGKPDDAQQLAMAGWQEGNQDEVRFVMALAMYERGEMQAAQALFFHSLQQGTPAVRAAVQIWLDRTGLTLP